MAGSAGAVRAVGDRLQTSSPLVSGWNVDDAAVSDPGRRGRCGPDRLGCVGGLDSGAGPPARRRREEDAPGRRSSKGGRSGDEPGRSGIAETGGPAGGGGQIGECLGRSRGGFTTKIHLAADGRCRPLALVLTPGHYGDGPQFERVLEQVSVPRHRSRTAPHPPRPCPGGQGLHIPEEPPLPATTRNPAHHPRTPRPAKTPQEPRLPRRPAHRLRQRALQETQHRRLPPHLAPHMIHSPWRRPRYSVPPFFVSTLPVVDLRNLES